MWNTNACQQKPHLTLRGTMPVHAWYSEVVVELYYKHLIIHLTQLLTALIPTNPNSYSLRVQIVDLSKLYHFTVALPPVVTPTVLLYQRCGHTI